MQKKQELANNQDVSEALGLLKTILKEERTRIFNAGSKAMNAQDAETARAVLDFVKKLDGFTEEVQKLIATWEVLLTDREAASPAVQDIVTGEGKLFGLKTRKATKGFSRKVTHPLASKTNFTVRFEDGTIIHSSKASDSFAQTIARIGAKKVAELALICCGEQLVSNRRSTKYPSESVLISKNYYVLTHSGTATKIKYLQTIAQALKQNITIILEKQ